MNTSNPKRGRNKRDECLADHGGADHREHVCNAGKEGRDEETSGKVACHERCPRFVEGFGYARGKREEASEAKDDEDAPYDVIVIEPVDSDRDIRPDLPAHGEGDNKTQQRLACRLFHCRVPSDGDDADVKQIDKQLIPGNLLRLVCPP